MHDMPLTLEAVDTFIGARHRGLTFPSWLERQLEHDTRRRRAQRLRSAVPAIAVIYNLYLLPDWLLVGDKIEIALILHFAVVTPWILLTGWFKGRQSKAASGRTGSVNSGRNRVADPCELRAHVVRQRQPLPVFRHAGRIVYEHRATFAIPLRHRCVRVDPYVSRFGCRCQRPFVGPCRIRCDNDPRGLRLSHPYKQLLS